MAGACSSNSVAWREAKLADLLVVGGDPPADIGAARDIDKIRLDRLRSRCSM